MAIYEVEEMSDLVIDAVITDRSCNFLFASIWARDTAIQELLGRLSLPSSDRESLTCLTLTGDGNYRPMYFNKDLLEKRISTHTETLFGTISNLFLWDKRLNEPDYANSSAYWVCRSDSYDEQQNRTWRLLRDLLPYPLLDHWKWPVLNAVDQVSTVESMWCLGRNLFCTKVEANLKPLTQEISQAIRRGNLTV